MSSSAADGGEGETLLSDLAIVEERNQLAERLSALRAEKDTLLVQLAKENQDFWASREEEEGDSVGTEVADASVRDQHRIIVRPMPVTEKHYAWSVPKFRGAVYHAPDLLRAKPYRAPNPWTSEKEEEGDDPVGSEVAPAPVRYRGWHHRAKEATKGEKLETVPSDLWDF